MLSPVARITVPASATAAAVEPPCSLVMKMRAEKVAKYTAQWKSDVDMENKWNVMTGALRGAIQQALHDPLAWLQPAEPQVLSPQATVPAQRVYSRRSVAATAHQPVVRMPLLLNRYRAAAVHAAVLLMIAFGSPLIGLVFAAATYGTLWGLSAQTMLPPM